MVKRQISTKIEFGEPWPERYVQWNRPGLHLVRQFRSTLEGARDEKPLQRFFKLHPEVLAIGIIGGPHRTWVFEKPRLGGGTYIPDFLVCNWSSLGPSWIIVELESPRRNPLTKKRSVSSACHHGVEQINDYRRYLRGHAEHEHALGRFGLNCDCAGWVVMGRGGLDPEDERVRLADLRQERIEIVSYDRILETYASLQKHLDGRWKTARSSIVSLKNRGTGRRS